MSPRDDVPEMPDHGVDEKEFAMLVPIIAPRIDRTVGQDLDHLAFRVIAPDSSVDGSP